MSAFSCKIPNGKYLATLYFAETYSGITGPGQRVFTFNLQGQEFRDFDIWVKAGGPNRAYIETVPLEVSNGGFRIVFTPKIENPAAINAIEIIPQTSAIPAGQWIPWRLLINASGNGFMWLKGHDIGRRWEIGPQREFFLPECWLKFGKEPKNVLVLGLRQTVDGAKLNTAEVSPYPDSAELLP